ncbi:hypothetical protein PG985_011085 [Apiospora marii]|uniref:SRR1-like domain-containing protein n=1 Tax=Apiospora marii TaxID=335849 RepID=A0ABR1SUG7_9PEZI
MSRSAAAVLTEWTPPLLENVGYTQWTLSTQAAAELYAGGAKLWTKESLRDIEQQLVEFQTRELFALRRLDGSTIRIKNPMFGKSDPIWTPRVVFHEYWRLVKAKPGFLPNGRLEELAVHPETYHCTCLVEWWNLTLHSFDGLGDGWEALAQQKKDLWESSETRQLLQARIKALVGPGSGRKANKVVCIGLPCLSRRAPSWWRIQNSRSEKPEIEAEFMHKDDMTQYCAAMTIANALRESQGGERDTTAGSPGDKVVRLITQERRYTEATKTYLRGLGFEVVGDHGAAGLAEIDDETVVLSFFTSTMAPVKQVVADIARPALFIGLFDMADFNEYWQPGANPESPRTRKMWEGYEAFDFPVAAEEVSSMDPMFKRLKVMARSAVVGSAREM